MGKGTWRGHQSTLTAAVGTRGGTRTPGGHGGVSGMPGLHGSGTGDGGGDSGDMGHRGAGWGEGLKVALGVAEGTQGKGGRGALDHGGGWPRVTGLWHLQRVLVVSPVSLCVPLPCGSACCSLWPCWALSLPGTLVSVPHTPARSWGHSGDTPRPRHRSAMPGAGGGWQRDPWCLPCPSSVPQPPASSRVSPQVTPPGCTTRW